MRAATYRSAWLLAGVLAVWPGVATAQTDEVSAAQADTLRAELDRLRQEFDGLRQDYGNRLADLERRLAALEAGRVEAAASAPGAPAQPAPETAPPPTVVEAPPQAQPPPGAPPAGTEAAVPPGAAGAGGPTGSLPIYGNVNLLSKIFNPDMAVIGNFLGAAGKNDVAPGPALEMNETEVSFQAIVDPYARADFFASFGAEGGEIEEGFITFPTVPGGFVVKVGKVKAAFGKVNTLHTHRLPWVDRPLVMENLLGGEEGIADGGISAARLIPNPWMFLEATGEVYRGDAGVFRSPERDDLMYLGRLRGYRDISESTNVDLGTSIAYGHNDAGPDFTTRLFGIDATFRYRPLRRAIYRRLLARTELMWSHREDVAGDLQAFGAYASGEYQFARRWFGGIRYDYAERALDPSLDDRGVSLLLTYWPSEFSQIRGQYRRTRYAEGSTANEVLFQFLFSIGAHGAHVF